LEAAATTATAVTASSTFQTPEKGKKATTAATTTEVTATGTAIEASQGETELQLDLHRFAGGPFIGAVWNAVVVWGSVLITTMVAFRYSTSGEGGLAQLPNTVYYIMFFASACSMVMDFFCMRPCIVPWLQKVKKLTVAGQEVDYYTFLLFRLSSTFIQAYTLHNNAWFMVKTVLSRDAIQPLWNQIRDHSIFYWCPLNDPASLAVVFFLLILVQFFVPLLRSLPCWDQKKEINFKYNPDQDEIRYDTLMKIFKERLGLDKFFGQDKGWQSTYHESLWNMAVATGMSLCGNMATSFNAAHLMTVIGDPPNVPSQGYKCPETGKRVEHGWVLRAIQALQMMQDAVTPRVIFVLFAKNVVQINLQIALFPIQSAIQGQNTWNDIMFCLTILFMVANVITELLAVRELNELVTLADKMGIFRELYQYRHAKYDDDDDDEHDEIYCQCGNEKKTVKDLKHQWKRFSNERIVVQIFRALSMFGVAYGLVRCIAMIFWCQGGLWSLSLPVHQGCVEWSS
jgi:hypothetical protein